MMKTILKNNFTQCFEFSILKNKKQYNPFHKYLQLSYFKKNFINGLSCKGMLAYNSYAKHSGSIQKC